MRSSTLPKYKPACQPLGARFFTSPLLVFVWPGTDLWMASVEVARPALLM